MTWTWYHIQDVVPYTSAKYSLFFEDLVRAFIEAKFILFKIVIPQIVIIHNTSPHFT